MGIGLSGTPNGSETLTVKPVDNGIYDDQGNEASTSQSNNTASLNAIGASLSFDGRDYVDVNTIADDMAGLTNWSFSVWVKPQTASFPEPLANIFGANCDNGTANCNKFEIRIIKADRKIELYEPGSTDLQGSAVSDGAWNHVVYSRTGSTGSLYLNGTYQGTLTSDHDAFVASDKWSLGQEFDGTTVTNEFFGLMDELAVWNEGLTSAEITALYNSGVALDAYSNSGNYTSSANLKGYWKMEEGTGTTLTDLSGYGNNGTIKGATWSMGKKSSSYTNIPKDCLLYTSDAADE